MEVVFHLVSTTLPKSSNDNPEYDVETNLVISVRLLEAARRRGTRKIVFLSSGGTVYGVPDRVPIDESHPCNPISSYGIVKLAIEKYLHLYRVLHGLDSCTVRLSRDRAASASWASPASWPTPPGRPRRSGRGPSA